jgi:hypothetical protein
MLPKGSPLLLFFSKMGHKLEIPRYAQGGFVSWKTIQTSPGRMAAKYSVIPVMAKHNLCQVHNYHPLSAKLKVPFIGQVDINSPDFDWLPTPDDCINLRLN